MSAATEGKKPQAVVQRFPILETPCLGKVRYSPVAYDYDSAKHMYHGRLANSNDTFEVRPGDEITYFSHRLDPIADPALVGNMAADIVECQAVDMDDDQYEQECDNLFPEDDEFIKTGSVLLWKGTPEYEEHIKKEEKKRKRKELEARMLKHAQRKKKQGKERSSKKKKPTPLEDRIGYLDLQLIVKDVQNGKTSRKYQTLDRQLAILKRKVADIKKNKPSSAAPIKRVRKKSPKLQAEHPKILPGRPEEGPCSDHSPTNTKPQPQQASDDVKVELKPDKPSDAHTQAEALVDEYLASFDRNVEILKQMIADQAESQKKEPVIVQFNTDVFAHFGAVQTQLNSLKKMAEEAQAIHIKDLLQSNTKEPAVKPAKKKLFRNLRKRCSRIINFFSRSFVRGRPED